MLAHVTREIEGFVAAAMPGGSLAQRAPFYRSLLALLDEDGGGDDDARDPLEGVGDAALSGKRNYIMHCLVQLCGGRRGAVDYCRAYLDPRRWSDLRQEPFFETCRGDTVYK